jgi:hypothetical protein
VDEGIGDPQWRCPQGRAHLPADHVPGRHALVIDRLGSYGGFWYVTDVKHEFDNVQNVSSTEATMCRAAQTSRMRPLSAPPQRRPTAVLLGDRWQANRAWEKVAS